MVIIFQKGNEFWIEFLSVALSIPDAAGNSQSSIVNLERSGNYIGGSVIATTSTDNDNTQAIGLVELRGSPTGTLSFGVFASGVRVRINKALGTAGASNVTFHFVVCMRGSHLKV